MSPQVFDKRICALGEGPLWHPIRQQLFWFDILGHKLLSRDGDTPLQWQFDEHVSAAGWIDENTLLIASETCLFSFDLISGAQSHLCDLEADNPVTRSNDGRADPWGGFWIGTMGKEAQTAAGAIYRYYQGQLHKLFDKISISNAICFSPQKDFAYFTDTPTGQIMRQELDQEGWPKGACEVLIDLRAQGLHPDGAVIDSEGCLWNAQWGASRVARYAATGAFLSAIEFPAKQTSCPAFGGQDLKQLFVSSAAVDLEPNHTAQGQTYVQSLNVKGQSEHRVIL